MSRGKGENSADGGLGTFDESRGQATGYSIMWRIKAQTRPYDERSWPNA